MARASRVCLRSFMLKTMAVVDRLGDGAVLVQKLSLLFVVAANDPVVVVDNNVWQKFQ